MSLASPPGKILEFYSIRKEANSLVRLGLPVIGAQLTQVAMNFVDTVMAGNLSALALAAVAVASLRAMQSPLQMLPNRRVEHNRARAVTTTPV